MGGQLLPGSLRLGHVALSLPPYSYLFGAHFHTANAIGNPTSTVWPIGPVITDAGSNLGGHRCTAESGSTTSVITTQTNSPYNNPAMTGRSIRNAICLLAT